MNSSSSAPARQATPPRRIQAVVTDVDGTLLDPHKALTPRTLAAVAAMRAAGIPFSLASSRPPAAFKGLIAALGLSVPFAAYNGGSIVRPDLSIVRAHPMAPDAVEQVLRGLRERKLGAWVFRDGLWLLCDPAGDYVDLEERTLGYGPTLVERFDDFERVDKIVSASADFALLARTEGEMQAEFGATLTVARSQQYYLDFTPPEANKGEAVRALADVLGVDLESVAVLGDMHNDVPMFEQAGFSIAMGQAAPDVCALANVTTESNADDGFALAIERWVLPYGAPGNATPSTPATPDHAA